MHVHICPHASASPMLNNSSLLKRCAQYLMAPKKKPAAAPNKRKSGKSGKSNWGNLNHRVKELCKIQTEPEKHKEQLAAKPLVIAHGVAAVTYQPDRSAANIVQSQVAAATYQPHSTIGKANQTSPLRCGFRSSHLAGRSWKPVIDACFQLALY